MQKFVFAGLALSVVTTATLAHSGLLWLSHAAAVVVGLWLAETSARPEQEKGR